MTINIRAMGMELTPAIRQYVEEKFESLDKFARITQIDVDLGMDSQHHQKGNIYACSATVQIPGDVLKIQRETEDLYKAIDKVKDHLREMLAQLKEKKIDRRKEG